MNPRLVALLTLFVSLSACADSTALTRTGPEYPPRDPSCDFLAFAAYPGTGFTEIGTIDVEPKSWAPFIRIDDFKEEIRPYVCQAGGDAVIAYVNGKGWYIKAVVLKQVAAPAEPSAQTRAPVPAAPAPPLAPGPAAGCQYDTQCKGDRVCTSGVCVDPVPAPAAPSTPAPN
jgi:hypothetical protein